VAGAKQIDRHHTIKSIATLQVGRVSEADRPVPLPQVDRYAPRRHESLESLYH
jgi:hypothetical protein